MRYRYFGQLYIQNFEYSINGSYIYFHTHKGHSINKRNCFEKEKEKKKTFLFFQDLFYKCKHCIVWDWFIAKFMLISQKYFFWGYSKCPQIKQGASGLNRLVVVGGDWEVQTMGIYRRMYDVYGKAIV